MWSFDVFFDLRLNQRLSKQLRPQWFEVPCTCYDVPVIITQLPLSYKLNGIQKGWHFIHDISIDWQILNRNMQKLFLNFDMYTFDKLYLQCYTILLFEFPNKNHLCVSNASHFTYVRLIIVYGAWQLWDPSQVMLWAHDPNFVMICVALKQKAKSSYHILLYICCHYLCKFATCSYF